MIKAIKKLFSVDESELDFDEIETSDENYTLYEKELNQFKEDTMANDVSVVEIIESSQNNTKIIPDESEPIIKTTQPVIKAYDQTTPDALNHNIVPLTDDENTGRRTFDFASEIEQAYSSKTGEVEKVKVEKVEKVVPKQEVKEEEAELDPLISKENYVLKDIISPMHGVVRKEKNVIKRDTEHKKAQIIKLREQVKTTEIDEDLSLPFESEGTLEFDIEKAQKLNIIKEDKKKQEALSETSRFTLIEDSTGEMKLVIDEDMEK